MNQNFFFHFGTHDTFKFFPHLHDYHHLWQDTHTYTETQTDRHMCTHSNLGVRTWFLFYYTFCFVCSHTFLLKLLLKLSKNKRQSVDSAWQQVKERWMKVVYRLPFYQPQIDRNLGQRHQIPEFGLRILKLCSLNILQQQNAFLLFIFPRLWSIPELGTGSGLSTGSLQALSVLPCPSLCSVPARMRGWDSSASVSLVHSPFIAGGKEFPSTTPSSFSPPLEVSGQLSRSQLDDRVFLLGLSSWMLVKS